MKKLIYSLLCGFGFSLGLMAQTPKATPELPADTAIAVADTLFQGVFYNEEIGLNIHLDLPDENLYVPDMAFLGPVGGYLDGRIYGVWMLISYNIKGETATLRFTNDIGSDSQTIVLSHKGNGVFDYRTVEGNNIRKVQNRKLVRIADRMQMKKKKKYHD